MKTAKIYGLVDPRDGEIRYVGRTKQKLYMRRQQHICEARKERIRNSRAEWIRSILKEGLRPLITHLQTVPEDEQVLYEGMWIEKLQNLVNDGTAKQGGTRSYIVDWTPELDALLGTVADSVIAEKVGVTRKAISYRRKVLGVPASYDRTRNTPPPLCKKILLEQWIIDLLGSMPDYKLGEQAGLSKRTINRARRERGIAAYAHSTGNDGKFRPGSFPPRWIKYA